MVPPLVGVSRTMTWSETARDSIERELCSVEFEIPGMDLHQLFCFDLHGIKVEFNFEGQDRPWKTLEKEHKAFKKRTKKKKGRKS